MIKVEIRLAIRAMFKKGYSKTQIARNFGVDRKTVRKIVAQEDVFAPSLKNPKPHQLDCHAEFICDSIAEGKSAAQIYKDLKANFNVKCSYSTVRDYVRKAKQNALYLPPRLFPKGEQEQ